MLTCSRDRWTKWVATITTTATTVTVAGRLCVDAERTADTAETVTEGVHERSVVGGDVIAEIAVTDGGPAKTAIEAMIGAEWADGMMSATVAGGNAVATGGVIAEAAAAATVAVGRRMAGGGGEQTAVVGSESVHRQCLSGRMAGRRTKSGVMLRPAPNQPSPRTLAQGLGVTRTRTRLFTSVGKKGW